MTKRTDNLVSKECSETNSSHLFYLLRLLLSLRRKEKTFQFRYSSFFSWSYDHTAVFSLIVYFTLISMSPLVSLYVQQLLYLKWSRIPVQRLKHCRCLFLQALFIYAFEYFCDCLYKHPYRNSSRSKCPFAWTKQSSWCYFWAPVPERLYAPKTGFPTTVSLNTIYRGNRRSVFIRRRDELSRWMNAEWWRYIILSLVI